VVGTSANEAMAHDKAVTDDAKPEVAPIQQLATLSACLVKDHPVKVKVHIAKHVPAITFIGDVDAKVKACITNAAKKLSLPIESGDMALTLTK